MIAAVFDCMLFLQAATSDRGPAFACLTLVEAGQVTLYVSPAILAEVQEVLMRPKIQTQFPHLTRDRVDVFLQKVATLATLVNDVPDAGFPVRDPDDLPYLNLAIAANAGYLVSWDNDLRDLMKDSSYTAKYPHVRIVDPPAFLGTARAMKTQ